MAEIERDRRAENWLKNAPELVRSGGKWELRGFVPLATAFNYPTASRRTAFVYGFHYDGFIKIGRTSNPEQRLAAVQRRFNGPKLEILKAEPVPYAGSIYAERLMHIRFEDHMLKREWFDMSPDDFLEYLPIAVIGAHLYDDECRRWWRQNHS